MLALCAVPFGVLAWNVGFLSLAQGRILSFNLLRSGQGVWFLLCLLGLLVVHRTSLMGVALCWATSMFVLGAFASLAGRTEKNGEEIPTKGFLGMAFRFGWRSHLGAVTQFLQQRIDILLVSYICSLRELGFYSLAVAMAELLWYIPQTVANVLMPHVAGNSDEGASRLTSSFCRAVFAINAFLAVALAIFSAWFIPLMLPAFRASVPVLWLLLPGTMAASISKVLSSDMNGRGRPLETVRPAAFSLAACFLTGALVIPKFGIEGAAVVTSAGYLLNAFLYLHAYSRITAVRAKDLLLLNYQDIRAVQASCKDFASQITR
jgi:O-antigen/teichoic acid export membrane protein